MDIVLRPPAPGDYSYLITRVNEWWGGRPMAPMLPRLFFDHFPDTTVVAVDGGGRIAGFLCGFVSQADVEACYIHFVGVDPGARGRGLGRALYSWLFARALELGCYRVTCVTSPLNTGSRAFHAAMGFTEHIVQGYDGPGEDRVVMGRTIA